MKNSLVSIAAIAAVLFLSGCDSSESANEAPTDGTSVSLQKIYVDQATLEQIAPHKKECKGANKDHKLCVEICHRPPGNPEKGKSKVLPLGAVRAHLCHGHSDISDADYVGPCHSEDDDSSSDDSSEDSETGDDSGAGGDTDTGDGDIPAWCAPYIDIDSDCDGLIDGTGDPLL